MCPGKPRYLAVSVSTIPTRRRQMSDIPAVIRRPFTIRMPEVVSDLSSFWSRSGTWSALPALPPGLEQGHGAGGGGVERADLRGGHGDGHDQVALLPHPGPHPLVFAADDQGQGLGQVRVINSLGSIGGGADNGEAGVFEPGQGSRPGWSPGRPAGIPGPRPRPWPPRASPPRPGPWG